MENDTQVDESMVTRNNNSVEFYKPNDIYFPNICLICGKETNKKFKKSITGKVNSSNFQYKVHHFDLPICKKCQGYLKSGVNRFSKEKNIIIASTLFAGVASIVIGILTFSIIFGIVFTSLSFLIPYINYRIKKNSQLRIEKYIKFQLDNSDQKIIMTFFNESYAENVMEVNSKNTESSRKEYNSYK